MTSTDHDLGQFARLVDALEPWLDRVLFIGGWAHRLFRERPEAARLSYPPLRTGDVDVALDPRVLERDAGIRERLAANGFREEFLGGDRPPVTHYSLGDEASGFYVEFLSPLLGGDRRRDGSRDVTERIAGVTAQKLRYLDILLVEPRTVTIAEEQGVPLARPATMLIPNWAHVGWAPDQNLVARSPARWSSIAARLVVAISTVCGQDRDADTGFTTGRAVLQPSGPPAVRPA